MAGHTTANVTVGIYGHVMDELNEQAREELRELTGGFIGQRSGSSATNGHQAAPESPMGTGGFEPPTSRV